MTKQSIVVVTSEAMLNDPLYRSMKSVGKDKIANMLASMQSIASEREDFEFKLERKRADGSLWSGESNDIRHLREVSSSESVARMFVSLKVNPREYLYPQSLEGGKSGSMTSNLKSYKKAREIAETIWIGSSDLENVAKVFSVCAFRFSSKLEVLRRDYCETFLSSVEFRTIDQASEDLWSAIDDVRAKHMTTGAQTQASQMIRTLVALKSAQDVQDGRSKNVAVDPNGRVLNALMRRFGQVTDTVSEEVTPETVPEVAPVHVEEVHA